MCSGTVFPYGGKVNAGNPTTVIVFVVTPEINLVVFNNTLAIFPRMTRIWVVCNLDPSLPQPLWTWVIPTSQSESHHFVTKNTGMRLSVPSGKQEAVMGKKINSQKKPFKSLLSTPRD